MLEHSPGYVCISSCHIALESVVIRFSVVGTGQMYDIVIQLNVLSEWKDVVRQKQDNAGFALEGANVKRSC